MLKRFFVLTLLSGMSVLGSGLLTGCGQTGPLYLPSEERSAQDLPKQGLPKQSPQNKDTTDESPAED